MGNKSNDSVAESRANDFQLLFKKAVAGDTNAFWSLIEPYSRLIYAIAFGIFNDPDQAQDILHDVYLEAFRSLGNLRNPNRFSAWLNTLTHNLCYEALRKKSRAKQKMSDVFLHQPRVMLVYEVLVKEEELKQLESALNTLPEPFRVILGLKYMNQYSCAEIAEILGISVAAVKSRLFEARKLLATRMTAAAQPGDFKVKGGSHNEL